MKPFDLGKALAGAKCITRDGREAYVKYREDGFEDFPLQGFFIEKNGTLVSDQWTLTGRWLVTNKDNPGDLFMAPKKRTVMVNFYREHSAEYFDSQEEADFNKKPHRIGDKSYPVEIDDE